jgi:Recombinase
MLDIEVAVAKKQSNDISRKTKIGMLEKAGQGLYPSVAPIGYKNNRLTHLIWNGRGKSDVYPQSVQLMASGSDSLAAIARILNQEGFRGRKGYRVGKSAIEKILKNPYLLWSLPLAGTITRRQSPLPSLQKIFSIRHAQPYMVTHVPTQTAVVLPLTTFSPVEIVGVRFWAKKKRNGLSITIAPFQRVDIAAGVMFPKERSLVFSSRRWRPSL